MVKLTFVPENKTVSFDYGNSIFETALENGIEIPSLCQMGLCSACMVYLEQGEEYIIEDIGGGNNFSEVNSKYVLSCISSLRKNTDDVEIIVNLEKTS